MGSLHASASTDMLRERVLAIHRALGTLQADIDPPGARQWRSAKLSGSGILAFVSLVLLPPTGGLAAFAAGLGMLFWANELREDAEASNRSEAAIRQYRQLVRELDEIETELKRRQI